LPSVESTPKASQEINFTNQKSFFGNGRYQEVVKTNTIKTENIQRDKALIFSKKKPELKRARKDKVSQSLQPFLEINKAQVNPNRN
jgi:hypothetical protein